MIIWPAFVNHFDHLIDDILALKGLWCPSLLLKCSTLLDWNKPGMFRTLYSAVEGPRTVTNIWRKHTMFFFFLPCTATRVNTFNHYWHSRRLWREEKYNKQINKPKTQHRTEVCWMSDTLAMKVSWKKGENCFWEEGVAALHGPSEKRKVSGVCECEAGICIVLSVGLCCVLFCVLKSYTMFRTLDNSLLVDFINKTSRCMPLAVYLQDQTIQGVISV